MVNCRLGVNIKEPRRVSGKRPGGGAGDDIIVIGARPNNVHTPVEGPIVAIEAEVDVAHELRIAIITV